MRKTEVLTIVAAVAVSGATVVHAAVVTQTGNQTTAGDWNVPAIWSNNEAPSATNTYICNDRLYSPNNPSGTDTFGGDSLTLDPTANLQLRNKDGDSETITMDMVMNGGFFAPNSGGTVNLDGTISVIADSTIKLYENATQVRNVTIDSLVSGGPGVTLRNFRGSDVTNAYTRVDNAANTFSGTWLSDDARFFFDNAGAAGINASIEVTSDGYTRVEGDWVGNTLTAVSGAEVEVKAGYTWVVLALNVNGTNVVDGTYTVADLNTETSDTIFTGTGTIVVDQDAAQHIPQFTVDPIVTSNATFGAEYGDLNETLDGSATNSLGEPMTYEYVSGPGWLTVATNGALSGTPTETGLAEFTIQAVAAGLYSSQATLQITVDALGNPPVFTTNIIVKADGAEEEEYGLLGQSLTNSATDVDGDTLTYAKTGGPGWLTIAPDGALSGVCDISGTNTFSVTVNDGNGGTDSATLLIYVEPLPPQLLHHWAFDEGTGTNAVDSAGSSDGEIVNAVWGSDGERGSFLSFNGTNSHVNPGLTLPLMTTLNDFTWAVWVNNGLAFPPTGSDPQRNSIIIGNRRDGTGADFTPREFLKFTPNQLEWRPNDVPDGTQYADLPVGTWVHLAVVKDGDNIQIYVNGVAGNSNTVGGFVNALPFFIGGEPGNSASEHFDGGIDDVRLYNYALTEAEIKGLVPAIGPTITDIDVGGGEILVTWTSKVGRAYDVVSTSELGAVTDWAVLSGLSNVVATSDSTTATVSTVGADVGYYRVEELPVLPIFFDDFESGAPGWTNGTGFGSTEWELGTPAFGAFTNAFSGTNAWGTNLDGEYGEDHKPWLRSPPIDLTAYGNVNIEFYHTRELEVENGNPFDYGFLHILDTNYTPLATNVYVATGMDATWTEVSRALPAAATGQVIVLEFELYSDEYQPSDMAGWHIDDVKIVEP